MRIFGYDEEVLVLSDPLIEVARNLITEVQMDHWLANDLWSLFYLFHLYELLEHVLSTVIKDVSILLELPAHHIEDFIFLKPRCDVRISFDFELWFLERAH